MASHTVGVAHLDDTGIEATVFTLPGCQIGAADETALAAMLPLAIAEFEVWLARHGEASARSGYEIIERVDSAATGAADGEFTFAWDREAATADEIEQALRWMCYARDDLTQVTSRLTDALLDWRPPDSAMSRIDQWKPHALTIREIIDDIAGAEGYYRSGVSDNASSAAAQPVELAMERERTITLFRALTTAQLARL